MLQSPLPAVDDTEGANIPTSLPFVVDAHVHLFPDSLFQSIWEWFDHFGWPIRYKLNAPCAIEFLLSRGVGHVIALHYAHKPGVARMLNAHMADLCRKYSHVTGTATIFPGEEDAEEILLEAFKMGLFGVKLHCHVQCFELDSVGMHRIYRVCSDQDMPLIMHVGREPKSPAYKCDPYLLCSAQKVERVLKDYPTLKVCVPHMGADEFESYRRMIEQYDTLWLDTTMTLAEYLPFKFEHSLEEMRTDRIMYGTDFPNIPYAWDREIRKLNNLGLSEASLAGILGKNAAELFGFGIGGDPVKQISKRSRNVWQK
ncbi:MAG TPA: amidohydrolase [Deltaproteobacteria bacterium]|nr:amidohydrolase [Deltaproteobacteria bacterium]